MSVSYDPRERFRDENEMTSISLDGLQGRIWTALPGIVVEVFPNNGSPYASVQPAVLGRTTSPNGSVTFQKLPVLPHCPLVFPRGGGFTLTFPVTKGDECLLVFSSRSIDEWWQTGKANPAHDLRMHDLSDAVAYVGLTSQKRPISSASMSASSTQLRSDDGKVYVDVSAESVTLASNGTTETISENSITWVVGGHTMTMDASGLTSNKDATFNGTVTGDKDVVAAGISGSVHVHPGVQPGSGSTGKPT